MRQLAEPATIEFLSHIPELSELYAMVEDESQRILLLIDDYQEEFFNSKVGHSLLCH